MKNKQKEKEKHSVPVTKVEFILKPEVENINNRKV